MRRKEKGEEKMPMITVRYVAPPHTRIEKRQVATAASNLAKIHLGKDPMVTAVIVEEIDRDSWFIAGELPTDTGLAAFWMDIKITAGTNTKAETSVFVQQAYHAMAGILGDLHQECYVLVHAVDGDSYGYGARTQNSRWADGREA